MVESFRDKVVLITGAGRGLGRALAVAFARQDSCLALNDLTPVNLDETITLARQATGRGRDAQIQDYLVDISQKMAVQSLILQIIDRWGRLDVVVNNAAVRPQATILDMDEWDWRRTLEVNLTGAFFVTQIAGRVMREQGNGVILNIGDAGGLVQAKLPLAAYSVSKAGLSELTRQAAQELACFGVRVNALAPGLLESESTRDGISADLLTKYQPGKLPLPEDVADLALFLCSPTAAAVSGQVLTCTANNI
jgi:3-oxoacyl-[acyl-carrier protein] reductase